MDDSSEGHLSGEWGAFSPAKGQAKPLKSQASMMHSKARKNMDDTLPHGASWA